MSPFLIPLLKSAIPYVIACVVGFTLAFGIQQLRITNVKQEFSQYKLDQQLAIQIEIDRANKQRKVAADDFLSQKAELQKAIDTGEIFARCVRAGKCGVVRYTTKPSTSGVSPPSGVDATSTDTVLAGTSDAAINECAETTLMINKLQADIENQPGY